MSLVTLGVADVPRATEFYRALGWRLSSASQPSISFFDLDGVALALWGRDELAADARLPAAHTDRFGGTAHAINVGTRAQVDAVLDAAVTAGAELLKPAELAEWGGYSGYFADPDGHPWEVAHNPGFPLAPDGRVQLP